MYIDMRIFLYNAALLQIFMKLFFLGSLIIFCLQNAKEMSFALVGDIAVAPQTKLINTIFSPVADILQKPDLCIGNLEGVLCGKQVPSRKKGKQSFNFRMQPAFAKIFAEAGFDILNLANNHSLDYGQIGFAETIAHLQTAKIAISGIKDQPAKIKLHGKNIWIVGFSTYGHHNSILEKKQLHWIQKLKTQCDLLIVTFHAGAEGNNHTHVPKKNEYSFGENRGNVYKFAREAIDHGADLIFGHGPHVLRGIEIYQDKLIAYSLGNFAGRGCLSFSGKKHMSTILLVWLKENGCFIKGKIVPITLKPDGLPKIDTQNRSIALIKDLSEEDFPNTHPQITPEGEFFKIP